MLQALVLVEASENTYFVKSDDFSSGCPSQEHPCLTLEEYASNQSEFFTSNSTFMFLSGTHTTRTVVLLANISNILLRLFEPNLQKCEVDLSIQCLNVSGFIVHGITLIMTRGKAKMVSWYFANCINIQIALSIFTSAGAPYQDKGAIWLHHSKAIFENCTFRESVRGSALCIHQESEVNITRSIFIGNSAQDYGGAINMTHSRLFVLRSTFANNSALHGGAVSAYSAEAILIDTTVIGNFGSAMIFVRSKIQFNGKSVFRDNINSILDSGAVQLIKATVSFSGYTYFENNYAQMNGGAIGGLIKSEVKLEGITQFINNTAKGQFGGAVSLIIHCKLLINGSILFANNSCVYTKVNCSGGAIIVASASEIEISGNATFKNNQADIGGAIFLRSSMLTLNWYASMKFISNFAKSLGGGIFHLDDITHFQCEFSIHAQYSRADVDNLPDCFLQLENFSFKNPHKYKIISINNTAGKDGHFMYGGLIDKCHVVDYNDLRFGILYDVVTKYRILDIQRFNDGSLSRNSISSETFTLCFCKPTNGNIDCDAIEQISTIRGARFNVSFVAFSQGNATTATTVLAKVSKTARLKLDQNSREIAAKCTTISYNMYSTQNVEQLKIYPNGTCRDSGLAAAIVNITFLPRMSYWVYGV